MNVKDIAATVAILGSGVALAACNKEQPATEVPSADEGGGVPDPDGAMDGGAEASCGGADHTGEGHCGDEAAAEGGDAAAEGGEEAAEGGEEAAEGE